MAGAERQARGYSRAAEPARIAAATARRADSRIRCATPGCGRVLGALAADGLVVIEHRKRRIVAERVRGITCEDCGSEWRPPPDGTQ